MSVVISGTDGITAPAVNAGNDVGQVAMFAMSTAPAGWLKANGATISRTTYAALFAAIGTTFGSGDGSTTFELPDMRGEFIRGWDDGRGVDSGRVFGSSQGDAIREMTGDFAFTDDNSPSMAVRVRQTSGVFTTTNATLSFVNSSGVPAAVTTGYSVNFTASNQVPTASEIRPTNVAVLACIKY